MSKKRLKKLADTMIRLTPEESQKLALVKLLKRVKTNARRWHKQQQQGLLQQANNPMMASNGAKTKYEFTYA